MIYPLNLVFDDLSCIYILLPIIDSKTRTTEAQLSKITQNPKTRECDMKLSEMASLSDPRWQNRKERPNQTTNIRDRAETAKRPVRG